MLNTTFVEMIEDMNMEDLELAIAAIEQEKADRKFEETFCAALLGDYTFNYVDSEHDVTLEGNFTSFLKALVANNKIKITCYDKDYLINNVYNYGDEINISLMSDDK